MIYEYNEKYYVKISPSIYREVSVSKNKDEFDVKPIGSKIEITDVDNLRVVDINNIKIEKKNDIVKEDVKKEYESDFVKTTSRHTFRK